MAHPHDRRCTPRWLAPLLAFGAVLVLAPGALAAAPALTYAASTIDGSGSLTDVSCSSSALCVAVDATGNVLSSSDPSGGVWSAAAPIDTVALTGVSCPMDTLCVAVDARGDVIHSTSPAAGAGTWSSPVAIDPGVSLTAVSCATYVQTTCVAVDSAGRELWSTTPGSGGWSTPTTIGDGSALHDVSCYPQFAAGTLCAAVDADGETLITHAPTSGAAWSPAPYPAAGSAGSANPAIDCGVDLCTGSDAGGEAVQFESHSGQPTFAEVAPAGAALPGAVLADVSCVAASDVFPFCAAVGSGGLIATRNPYDEQLDPSASFPPWVAQTPDPQGRDLHAISCPVDGLCVAVGAQGALVTGVGATLTVTASGQDWGRAGVFAEGWAEYNQLCVSFGPCTLYYALGAQLTLTATASEPTDTLTAWGGACSGSAPTCAVTLSGPTTVTETFASLGTAPPGPGVITSPLTVAVAGTGSGTVSDVNVATCSSTCIWTEPSGLPIELIATASPGSTFAGWSGACSGTGACMVAAGTSAAAATATFLAAAAASGSSGPPPVTPAPAPASLPTPVRAQITQLVVRTSASAATASFTLAGTAPASVQCALVKEGAGAHHAPRYASCHSGVRFGHLRRGRYELIVRASSAAGSAQVTLSERRVFNVRG